MTSVNLRMGSLWALHWDWLWFKGLVLVPWVLRVSGTSLAHPSKLQWESHPSSF